MKNTKTKLAAVIIMFVMVLLSAIIGLGGLSVKAFADGGGTSAPEAPHGPNKVYYFYDYYPTLNIRMLTEEFSDIEAVYDFKHIRNEQDLDVLLNMNYFSHYGKDYVVIIDIKTFMPTQAQVDELFGSIKSRGEESAKTIFVSAYDEYSPSIYLDEFVYDNCYAMRFAIEWTLENFVNTAILIDRRMVDVVNNFGADLDTLCETSPFLRILLDVIGNTYGISSYNDIADELIDNNVKLLVQMDEIGPCFLDILTWEHVDFYTFGEVLNENNYYSDSNAIEHVYGFGFWYLDGYLYRLLEEGSNMMDTRDFGIGIVEIDPIIWDENGLPIGDLLDDANFPAQELLNILHGFI